MNVPETGDKERRSGFRELSEMLRLVSEQKLGELIVT